MKGFVHSVETFGTVDGPGIRYVVFFRGCPLRCKYCHNPDTWTRGEERDAEELVCDALRYRAFLRGGGITASGGEPLAQPAFLADLFERAKAAGLDTCLDTSGFPFPENRAEIERAIRATDLVLLDVKHADPAEHRKLTGRTNESAVAFARYLDEIGKPVWIRHVVVPGITDGEESARKVGALLAEFDNVTALDVLPYHTMGKAKYERLGLEYPLGDTPPATEEQAFRVKEWILDERRRKKRARARN